jgi:hypothetical protein
MERDREKQKARKENRSAKVKARKSQERGIANAKVSNLRPKKECKGACAKVSARKCESASVKAKNGLAQLWNVCESFAFLHQVESEIKWPFQIVI